MPHGEPGKGQREKDQGKLSEGKLATLIKNPKITATPINQPDAVATAGCFAKVLAVRSRNTMITYTRASTTKTMNNFPSPPPPIHAWYRQWNDLRCVLT